MKSNTKQSAYASRRKGFRRAISLVEKDLRKAGETRGFAMAKLLTHWDDIVGTTVAQICSPVKVSYSQGGFGATLVVLTKGAQAPMLEMQMPMIREKVNACYGYNAIQRVRITQTAPVGFAESQSPFRYQPVVEKPVKDAKITEKATQAASEVKDPDLRAILAAFGENVMNKERRSRDEQ